VFLGQTPLHFAASLGKWEAAVALLEDACCLLDELYTETRPKTFDEKYHRNSTKYIKDKDTLLHFDSKRMQLANKEQMKRQYSLLWAKDSQGNSVFHLAVIHNRQKMYQKLHAFSENLSRKLNETYFGFEATQSDLAGSKFNSFEAYDDTFLKNDNGYTPLELAAYLGNVEMMQFLLQTFDTKRKWGFANNSIQLKQVCLIICVSPSYVDGT
jgi:ankyrin repeat protein